MQARHVSSRRKAALLARLSKTSFFRRVHCRRSATRAHSTGTMSRLSCCSSKRWTSKPTSPISSFDSSCSGTVSYTHLRAHETRHDLVCRLLLEKKKKKKKTKIHK